MTDDAHTVQLLPVSTPTKRAVVRLAICAVRTHVPCVRAGVRTGSHVHAVHNRGKFHVRAYMRAYIHERACARARARTHTHRCVCACVCISNVTAVSTPQNSDGATSPPACPMQYPASAL